MMKFCILLIAIGIANCAFLEDYSSCDYDINVKCSLVPWVKSCYEKYDYCLVDGWYYSVKKHECIKIHIEDGWYPTDNFYETKKECECACPCDVHTISEYKNLDPTYVCKQKPYWYECGYYEEHWSGSLWYYDAKCKQCKKFKWPGENYKPSYNVYHSLEDCEDFCINYLYDHEDKHYDDYDYHNDYDYKDDYNKKDDYHDEGNYDNKDDYHDEDDYENKDNYGNEYEDYNNKDDYEDEHDYEEKKDYDDKYHGGSYGGNSY